METVNREKRSESRTTPISDNAKGELFHAGSKRYFSLMAVRDISRHGMGLLVDDFLRRGEEVRLAFKYGRVHTYSYAQVMWCRASSQLNGFEMGIRFQ